MPDTVRDNAAQNRFELAVEGGMAFATYRRTENTVIITHTETPPALRGKGIATRLVAGALAMIRAENRKPIAGCSFVADYMAKRPEAGR